MNNVFSVIEQIAADLANDGANPVVAAYGVGADVLAHTIQGLLGLFHKTKNAAADPQATPRPVI